MKNAILILTVHFSTNTIIFVLALSLVLEDVKLFLAGFGGYVMMDEFFPVPTVSTHARIVSASDPARCLDAVQLQRLEESFRSWVESSTRPSLHWSRKRILLIFLLIRYTGARLSEILNLDPWVEIDCHRQLVHLRKSDDARASGRDVQIPEVLSTEICKTLDDLRLGNLSGKILKVDQGHVRRKFYARAEAAGIVRELGTPEVIRRSRAVEMMQSNVPLPVVQKILGHSTPSLAASYVEFSDKEIREVARSFAEKENQRKTSARNTFFGKIEAVHRGDLQTIVEMVSLGGARICSVITNYSLSRLGLKPGTLAMAEVKAPWVMLFKGKEEPRCTAENRFCGALSRILEGKVTTEVVVRIPDGTELCAVITAKSKQTLSICENDPIWVAFSAFAVVIHVD
jgi:molybdate transport system regulatory protein